MADDDTARGAVGRWLRKPEAWLALIAMVISALSFWFNYAYPGKLLIVGPDRVGVRCEVKPETEAPPPSEDMQPVTGSESKPYKRITGVIFPVTLVHTGAQRTRWNVRKVVGDITSLTVPGADVHLDWRTEIRFVSELEYKGEKKTAAEDYTEYINRAFPFTLAGSQAITKAYEFTTSPAGDLPPDRDPPCTAATEFRLRVDVQTMRGQPKFEGTYACDRKDLERSDNFIWCNQQPTETPEQENDRNDSSSPLDQLGRVRFLAGQWEIKESGSASESLVGPSAVGQVAIEPQAVSIRVVLNRHDDNRFELRFEAREDSADAQPAKWRLQQAYLLSRSG